jgi:predicted enzyme related to lactoylglutathione lyase
MAILINIDVPDLAQGERFYSAAFGLEPARRLGAHALEMRGWPTLVYLLEKRADSVGAGRDPRRYERHWTPIHLDVVVTDLDAAVARACRAGAIMERPQEEAAYGRIAMLADPFGHGFCLIEFNASGYDAVAGATAAAPGS